MNELIGAIVSQLGVGEDQAKGGAGLLLKLAKEKLGGDFSKVTDVIGGADDLIKAAPAEGGTGKMLGGLASALGGGKLGNLAELAGGFKGLGLDTGMISKFAEIIMGFVKDKGGAGVMGLLQKVLK